MTKSEKKKFVRELTGEIRDSILGKIEDGTVPENWDGMELRALIQILAKSAASISTIAKEPRGRRARAFRQDILQRNLI